MSKIISIILDIAFITLAGFLLIQMRSEVVATREQIRQLQERVEVSNRISAESHKKLKEYKSSQTEVKKQFEETKANNPDPGNERIPVDRLLIIQGSIHRANTSIH